MFDPGTLLFNHYRVEALIGSGAFTEVYRVRRGPLDVVRALKVLRREAPGLGELYYAEARRRFEVEARIGPLFRPSSNIVAVLDLLEEGDVMALEMEYAPGGSLAECIQRTRDPGLEISTVVDIALDMANGLSAIHSADIVHRDLKPSNVLFGKEGDGLKAKLTDLGLAQLLSDSNSIGSVSVRHPGTPAYMSPEQENSVGYLTPASDIYSFGLVLFEMLTGRLYKNRRAGTPVLHLRPDCPRWLSDFTELCLLEEANSRPYDGAELIRALQRLREHGTRSVQAAAVKPLHIEIYEVLNSNAFSTEDLEDLCFRLDVDLDALSSESTKGAKARAIVRYFLQKSVLDELQHAVLGLRPQLAGRTSILFLAADPTDASRLRLGEELREIQEKLQLAKLRENFEIHQKMSVRPADISQALLDTRPRIVHFSGHGTATGAICIEDEMGKTHPVGRESLAALFEQFSEHVNCVVLNACYSEAQAQAIAGSVPWVVGMNKAIGDKAAIAFSVGFYQALGAGRTIEDAYKLGCVQVRMHNIPEHLTPILIKRE